MYINGFTEASLKGIADDFSIVVEELDGIEVIYALYTYECYSGCARVIFEKDGKLYEVNGSHCSCYGLEGQWKPEETTWNALAIRKDRYFLYDATSKDKMEYWLAVGKGLKIVE